MLKYYKVPLWPVRSCDMSQPRTEPEKQPFSIYTLKTKPCNPFQQNSKNFSGETHRLSEYSWKAHHPTTVLAPLYTPPPLLLRFGASTLRNKDFHMSNEQRAPGCWGYTRGYTEFYYPLLWCLLCSGWWFLGMLFGVQSYGTSLSVAMGVQGMYPPGK